MSFRFRNDEVRRFDMVHCGAAWRQDMTIENIDSARLHSSFCTVLSRHLQDFVRESLIRMFLCFAPQFHAKSRTKACEIIRHGKSDSLVNHIGGSVTTESHRYVHLRY